MQGESADGKVDAGGILSNKSKKQKKAKKEPETFSEHVVSWIKTILGAIIVVMIINGLLVASFVVPTGSMKNTVLSGDFLFVNKFIYGPSTPQVIPFVNIPLPFYKFPGIKDPERGDVIVFIYPGDRDVAEPNEFQYYLKRCVAAAGDTVQIIDKKLFVNGEESPLPPNGRYNYSLPPMANDQWKTFPAGRGYTKDVYGPLYVPRKGDTLHLTKFNIQEWEYFIAKEGHEVFLSGEKVYIDEKPVDFYIVERDYCFALGDNRDDSIDSRFWGFVPYENVVGTPMIVYWSWDTDLPISDIFGKISSIRWSRIGTIIK